MAIIDSADTKSVTIELLYFDGCPNHELLLPRLRELLAAADISVAIDLRRVTDETQARRERFLGSPTVRVDGHDVEPGANQREDYGMKCRLYCTSTGLSGQPPLDWIRATLRAFGGARR
jgi:hypothetical protein